MKKLGFGLMRLPLLPGGDQKNIDKEKTKALIDAFMARGFNYFDTAYPYHRGSSEKVFGELVADRYPRESYIVTSKMPSWLIQKREDYDLIFEKQLSRTHVGYFDWYLLHALGNEFTDIIESTDGFGYVRGLKEKGLIRHMGFSFHGDSEALRKLLDAHPDVELVQLQINYADWESPSVEARKCYELCTERGIPVSVMEPLKGGALVRLPEKALSLLSGETPADFAFRFTMKENVMVVLSGMGTMEELEKNMDLFENPKPFTPEEEEKAKKITAILEETAAIRCTACRYCTDGCPQKIAIPEYFSLYNAMKVYGYEPSMNNMYDSLKVVHGAPGDCIGCGQCEEHCPQKVEIMKNLQVVRETFEK